MQTYQHGKSNSLDKELKGEKRDAGDPFSISISSTSGGFSSTIVGFVGPKEREFPSRPVYSHQGKIKLKPEKMERDVFYLISYKGEKFAVRKLDENRFEFREVID